MTEYKPEFLQFLETFFCITAIFPCLLLLFVYIFNNKLNKYAAYIKLQPIFSILFSMIFSLFNIENLNLFCKIDAFIINTSDLILLLSLTSVTFLAMLSVLDKDYYKENLKKYCIICSLVDILVPFIYISVLFVLFNGYIKHMGRYCSIQIEIKQIIDTVVEVILLGLNIFFFVKIMSCVCDPEKRANNKSYFRPVLMLISQILVFGINIALIFNGTYLYLIFLININILSVVYCLEESVRHFLSEKCFCCCKNEGKEYQKIKSDDSRNLDINERNSTQYGSNDRLNTQLTNGRLGSYDEMEQTLNRGREEEGNDFD